jgi:hypothetical protein
LFPERLDDWIAEDNPVRVIDAFVERHACASSVSLSSERRCSRIRYF